MTWPTDDLTNANTDAPTDRPDLARDEINSTILKVKSILGEAPAGSLLLTNQDEGTGNGLDADTVDGEHASAFADASHNHSAANITSGTLPLTRGGIGITSAPIYSVILSAGSSLWYLSPTTDGYALMSNGPSTYPTFQPLPSFPTVDVNASDFVNGTVSVYPDSNAYDWDTGFGTNNFQLGLSGSLGGVIVVAYSVANGYRTFHCGDTDGVSITFMPNISGISTGHVRFSINGTGGATNVYVWARTNL